MALRTVYERFLASPDPELLGGEPSLHYITTTTTHANSEAILKHLSTLKRVLRKLSEKTLSVVEGSSSLCLDIETKLEFISNGGPYLPDLDDNFVVDQTVTIPIIHIVHFDDQNRITQIRQHWDQGSLLKQIGIIGQRSSSWPIRDGAEQLRLINSSVAAAARSAPLSVSTPAPSQSDKNGFDSTLSSPSKKKDPHASLSLFEQRNIDEHVPRTTRSSVSSAKPPVREYNELFGEDELDVTPTKPQQGIPETPRTNTKKYNHFEFGVGTAPPRSESRSKPRSHFELGEAKVFDPTAKQAKPSKAPGHFEFGEADAPVVGKAKPLKPNRDSHFDFGDAEFPGDKQSLPARPRSSKHMSQWDFEDFVTPQKTNRKVGAQNLRNIGWSDDEVDQSETPKPQLRVPRPPRQNAEVHFKIQDEASPLPEGKRPVKKTNDAVHKGLKLYENNLYEEDEGKTSTQAEARVPLSTAHNAVNRRKDFDSHWLMTDETPAEDKDASDEHKHINADRMKAVRMMDSSWDTQTDDANQDQEVNPLPKRASRVGRDVNQRHWGFGDSD
ncbi:hypothetical protein FQN57_005462 [Myotisia sp. PD_48]|nr:hypothetical protein FQN57_005462 [Myotisia sp. PD_48]